MTNTTRPVSFINFHGMTLLVVENGGKNYVEVKPLGDLVGMKWRTLRETVQSGDNLILYGTRRLLPVLFNVLRTNKALLTDVSGPPRGPQTPGQEVSEGVSETENESENGVLHILFERVQMFLARINTSQMRVQGNVVGADYLLALQVEWAQVLHKYDLGEQVKVFQAELIKLINARAGKTTPAEATALTALIGKTLAEMGHPLPADPQHSLPLES